MGLRAKPPIQVKGDALIYEEAQKKHEYVILVDVAKGRGQDYSTFNVIDISSRPFRTDGAKNGKLRNFDAFHVGLNLT